MKHVQKIRKVQGGHIAVMIMKRETGRFTDCFITVMPLPTAVAFALRDGTYRSGRNGKNLNPSWEGVM